MRTKEIIQSFVGSSKIVLKDVYTDADKLYPAEWTLIV